MTAATATLAQLKAAHESAHELGIKLVEYSQGSPAASVRTGRFTAAEIDTEVTGAIEALLPFAAATTVVGLAVTGTAACAALATSQLTATATKADLSTADVSATATWATSNAAKATVSAAGLVTGVAAGVCNITATYGTYSVTTEFTVTA